MSEIITDKITIIVPVYNSEHYLEKCIESLINQSYKNLEIIIVNDGSTDRTEEICKRFELSDTRIKVINQINLGVSQARNTALEEATGKYIGFVDSDDYIEKNMYEVMHDEMTSTGADLAVCGYYISKDGKDIKSYKPQSKILEVSDCLELLIEDKVVRNFLWSMLFKKELFNNITFPLKTVYEDVSVIYKLILKTNKIALINQNLYHYVQRDNSITSQKSFDNGIILYNTLVEQRNVITQSYPFLYKKCLMHELRYLTFFSFAEKADKKASNLKLIKEYERKTLKLIEKCEELNFREKISLRVTKHSYYINYLFYLVKESIKSNAYLLTYLTTKR